MKNALKIGTGILGGSSGASSPLLTGLLAYWKLDEVSGNRLDSVGTRHMVPQATIGNAVGKIGNCATASGTGNYLGVTDASLLTIDWAAGFSIVGWVYVPTVYSGRNTPLAKCTNATYDWVLYSNAQNAHRFQVQDSSSGSSLAASATNITLDAWHFYAGRYNASTKKAEFRLDAEGWNLGSALTNGPRNSEQQLRIANYVNLYGSAYYDETGMWGYLSDDEVDDLYNLGAGKTHPF